MRIAFFGLPLAALLLLADGHEIAFCLLSRPDTPGRRRLTRKLGDEVRVRGDLTDGQIGAALKSARPDLLVSWFFTAKLPMSFVKTARLGGFGVHPSLLPRYRGPDPYFAAIDQGDRVTGVTAHRIEAEYDTGAILGRRELAIDPVWTAWQLARKLDRPSLALLRETVRRLAVGDTIAEEAQDEALATLAPAPSDDDCAIVWTWPVERILRRVRALSPSPGAFTEIGEDVVTVVAARATSDYPRALSPGEAAIVGDRAVIRAGDGAVELLIGEIDGEPLDARGLVGVVARNRDLVLG
ncbi:MAG: formyltransferase family protein [Polyangiaceae bacterium]